jgi:hypothetical protein
VVSRCTFARGVADLRVVSGFGGRHLQFVGMKDTGCAELRFCRVLGQLMRPTLSQCGRAVGHARKSE